MLSVLAFKKSLFAGVLDGGERDVFLQGTRLSQFMKSVEQVAGAIGEADADPAAEPPLAAGSGGVRSPAVDRAQTADAVNIVQTADAVGGSAPGAAAGQPGPSTAPGAEDAAQVEPAAEPADPWATILEAGAALLQGLATARAAGGSVPPAAPFTIERDPATGQASVRLPLPDAAVLQRLAKAFEPWLR